MHISVAIQAIASAGLEGVVRPVTAAASNDEKAISSANSANDEAAARASRAR